MMFNSKGKVYYGMHFYPGVAEYQEPGKDPYRVFLNENTLRKMDPSFAGRPIFVEHVDEVDTDVSELRHEADGWVIESFFNTADGKHWAKFIIVSELGERSIASGMRLSNAYIPNAFSNGGLWNGVQYEKEITDGEFEHLAIVKNPRYEESVIMTPEEFKLYNENHVVELKRLSNSNDKQGVNKMAFKIFKRTKVENSIDIEGMSVMLPKSGKEITITKLINDADEKAVDTNSGLADMSHKVKMQDGSYCNVGDLLASHTAMSAELEEFKKKKEPEADIENSENEDDEKKKKDNAEDDEEKEKKNAEDEAAKKEADEKKKNDEDEAKKAESEKKKNAKTKAEALRNAHLRDEETETAVVEFSGDQVARGKTRYGS